MESRSGSSHDAQARFYVRFGWAALVVVQLGFAMPYWVPVVTGTSFPWFVHAHAATFFGWTMLFLMQAILVRRGHVSRHRAMGVVGGIWAVATVVLGVWMAMVTIARDVELVDGTFGAVFTIIPTSQICMFTCLVGLALARTGEPAVHKRLMVLASLVVTTPAFARIGMLVFPDAGPPLVASVFVVTNGLLVAVAWWDRVLTGRLHPVYLWGGIGILAVRVARVPLAMTDAWRSFAEWLAG